MNTYLKIIAATIYGISLIPGTASAHGSTIKRFIHSSGGDAYPLLGAYIEKLITEQREQLKSQQKQYRQGPREEEKLSHCLKLPNTRVLHGSGRKACPLFGDFPNLEQRYKRIRLHTAYSPVSFINNEVFYNKEVRTQQERFRKTQQLLSPLLSQKFHLEQR